MKKIAHVLLIDDDDMNNFITQKRLEAHCDKIDVLKNGEEAKKYFDGIGDKYPSLVFLDINMPLMDGHEFLNWFQEAGHSGKTSIIMLSTSIMPSDMKPALEFKDVVKYMEKPLTPEAIKDLVATYA